MLKQELAPRGVGIPVLQGGEEVKERAMGKPIRWTKRLWKLARGQNAMQNAYRLRETPLLLAYWQTMAQQDMRNSYYGDHLMRPIYQRLNEFKHRKRYGEDDDIAF